jgi:hypothetical protein
MRRSSLFVALALSACAETGGPRASSHLAPGRATLSEESSAAERRFTGTWSALELPEPTPAEAMAMDPIEAESNTIQELPWAHPPAGVSCVVRGSTAPFPPPCEGLQIAVSSSSGEPLASFTASNLDVVWGVRAPGSAPWIHARSGAFTLTGFTRLDDVKFRVPRATPLVDGHVWILPDAPVAIVGATDEGALRVHVVDDVAGLERLVGEIPCDAVAFDPAPPPEPFAVAPPTPAPDDAEFVYPRDDRLTLRATPGGHPLGRLAGSDEATVTQELRVVDHQGHATRVRFETLYARFDVWVQDSEITSDPIGMRGFGSGIGCSGGRGVGRLGRLPPPRIVREASAIRVGRQPESAVPAIRVAAGLSLQLGEVRGAFVEVRSESVDRFTPLGENRFWIAEAALAEPER